jgi:hypothetical protein
VVPGAGPGQASPTLSRCASEVRPGMGGEESLHNMECKDYPK